jgi:hypothetical protein
MSNLDMVAATAAYFCRVNAYDCHAVVTDDTGMVVQFVPAQSYSLDMKVGTVLTGGVLAECLATKKKVTRIIPEYAFGVKLKVVVEPVFEENGRLSGTISLGTSMKEQEAIHQAAQSIASTTQQMMATTEEVAATASQLAMELGQVKGGGENVLVEVQKTDAILQFVSEIANKSNLLGLNAAIEAARAGDHGRGFAVVAEEIRKMATNSSQSVKDITFIMKAIRGETEAVVKTIVHTTEYGERQAAACEEISAAMQQLNMTVAALENIAKITSA